MPLADNKDLVWDMPMRTCNMEEQHKGPCDIYTLLKGSMYRRGASNTRRTHLDSAPGVQALTLLRFLVALQIMHVLQGATRCLAALLTGAGGCTSREGAC
jgi:hypothetical protein